MICPICRHETKHVDIEFPCSGQVVDRQQEWTQSGTSVRGNNGVLFSCPSADDARSAVSFHNAALAAEREKRDRIVMDDRSWGELKLEWRESDGRHYLYDKTGNFLWSGEPSYNIWRCVKLTQELAAERQTNIDAVTMACGILREEHRKELAAERQYDMCDACAGTGKPVSGKPCMCNGTGRMSIAAITLRKELYDERQRREQAEGAQHHMEACRTLLDVPDDEVLYQAIKDMQEQLLSAQAAIERDKTDAGHIHRMIEASEKTAGRSLTYDEIKLAANNIQARNIDLSLLHQHDAEKAAEVRKPLVTVLQNLCELCTKPKNERMAREWTGKIFCSAVKDICDAALVQCK